MLNTVRAILADPRYTGRQVWNHRRTDHNGPIQDGCDVVITPATR